VSGVGQQCRRSTQFDWHMSGSPVSSFCAHSVLCLFAFLYAGVLRGVMFLTGRLTPFLQLALLCLSQCPPPPSLTSAWPHLRCDVGRVKGEN